MAGGVTAQTFKTLHIFTGGSGGSGPSAGLVLSDNTLYGTVNGGGAGGAGAVFALNTDGTGLRILHSFTATSDGADPFAGLVISGNTLYGTARYGGAYGHGTVYRVNTDGTGFTNLYSFTGGNDGDYPDARLTLSGDTLYGTTGSGANAGSGTVFKINTDGTRFANLHRFAALPAPLTGTNSDGANPGASLLLLGDTLYGTAGYGGSAGSGAVFKVNTDGTGFTNLHHFSAIAAPYSPNSDGAFPRAKLISSGSTLYGTTFYGGSSGYGTLFKVRINGTGFTSLYSFPPLPPGPIPTNSFGADPFGGLMLSGNTLFGTTHYGGTAGYGVVYQINTDGTGITNLHSFTRGSDGAYPFADLILSGLTLYGTAPNGGSSEFNGTVFSISFPPPPLTITPSGANVILTWRIDPFGFTLQSTPSLDSGATIWTTVSPEPVVLNAENLVINSATQPQLFYRLRQ